MGLKAGLGRESPSGREHSYDDLLGELRRGADRWPRCADVALSNLGHTAPEGEIPHQHWGSGRNQPADPESPPSILARPGDRAPPTASRSRTRPPHTDDRGLEWCVYDNQRVLSWWPWLPVAGMTSAPNSLRSRAYPRAEGYPVDWLTRDLEIAAEVTTDALIPGPDPVRGLLLSGTDAERAASQRMPVAPRYPTTGRPRWP